MADEEVLLELLRVLWWDERRGEVAEAGGDAVNDLAAVDQVFDDGARFGHPRAGMNVELRLCAGARDCFDIRDREIGTGQDDRPAASGSAVRGEERGVRAGHDAEHSRVSCPAIPDPHASDADGGPNPRANGS